MIKIEFSADLFQDGSNIFGAITEDPDLDNLASFLMDDGGLGVNFLCSGTIELLEDIEGNVDHSDMLVERDREDWGVIIKQNNTKIFWLRDDDEDEHAQWVDTQLVIESLKQCILFIQEHYTQDHQVISPNRFGVYSAKIEVLDSQTGEWLQKNTNGGESAMFPEVWSDARIKQEVAYAYGNRTDYVGPRGKKMWTGCTKSGVKVKGYSEPSTTVYPLLE